MDRYRAPQPPVSSAPDIDGKVSRSMLAQFKREAPAEARAPSGGDKAGGDLVSSLAKRLSALEKDARARNSLLSAAQAENETLRSKLKAVEEEVNKRAQEAAPEPLHLQVENARLRTQLTHAWQQVADLKSFLSDYGLIWVGEGSGGSSSNSRPESAANADSNGNGNHMHVNGRPSASSSSHPLLTPLPARRASSTNGAAAAPSAAAPASAATSAASAMPGPQPQPPQQPRPSPSPRTSISDARQLPPMQGAPKRISSSGAGSSAQPQVMSPNKPLLQHSSSANGSGAGAAQPPATDVSLTAPGGASGSGGGRGSVSNGSSSAARAGATPAIASSSSAAAAAAAAAPPPPGGSSGSSSHKPAAVAASSASGSSSSPKASAHPSAAALAQPLQLPFGLTVLALQAKLDDLNSLVGDGCGKIVPGARGSHVLETPSTVRLTLYRDGLQLHNSPGKPFTDAGMRGVLKDLLDGYFPFSLKAEFPDGVPIQLVDRTHEVMPPAGMQPSGGGGNGGSNMHNFQDLGSNAAKPLTREKFLDRLPPAVIRNGRVVDVRSEVERLMRPPSSGDPKVAHIATPVDALLSTVQRNHTGPVLPPPSREGARPSAAEVATLQVKSEDGKQTFIVRLNFDDSIKSLREAIDKHRTNGVEGAKASKPKAYEIRTAFPPRAYTDGSETLRQAGLIPNATLVLRTPPPAV